MNREEIAAFKARVEIIKKNRNEFMDETIKLSGENKDLRKQLKAAEKEVKAGKRLYIDAQKRCKAQALRGDALEEEKKELGEQLAHWMGEGEPESPEDVEYRKLISKKRSDEENKRLRKLIQVITEQSLLWWKRKYYQLKTNTTKQALKGK